jgi:hypothetical protein
MGVNDQDRQSFVRSRAIDRAMKAVPIQRDQSRGYAQEDISGSGCYISS